MSKHDSLVANLTSLPNREYDPNELLTEQQAAAMFNLTPRCFQNWRLTGRGPNFVRISSRAVRYRRQTLIDFAESLAHKSTSEASKSA